MIKVTNSNLKALNTPISKPMKEIDSNFPIFKHPDIFDEFIIKHSNKGEKITSKEAIKLIFDGAVSQMKGLVKTAIKNPLKIVVPVIISTATIMALPLVGIPSAVGAGTIAIATALISVGRLGTNIYKLCQNNKQEEYNKARENYKNIGNSSLDLLLSLPFIPKSIKAIKDFAKYGKFHLNISAIKNLKNPKEILPTLRKANQEIYRSYDYTKIVDKQLSTYNIPEIEKAQIRKELLDFNVPEDEIANVVLKKLAKSKGYTHYPKTEYAVLRDNVGGSYNGRTGKLLLKDKTKQPIPLKKCGERIRLKDILPYDETTYKCQMENSITGEISYEFAPKKLMDDFQRLNKKNYSLSQQGQTISIVVHEFEHFDQYAKITRYTGISPNCTPKAKKLYQQAIKKQGKITQNSPLITEIKSYLNINRSENKNYVKYLQNPLEIGAREAQARAINTPEFQRLECVFKELPQLQEVSIVENLIPSVVQATAVSI